MPTVFSEPPSRQEIAWESWEHWKFGQRAPEHVVFVDGRGVLKEPDANWCFTCSKRGWILSPEPAANGEGDILRRAMCPTCKGKGSV